MKRSKRADRHYRRGLLKIAGVFILLFAVGCGVFAANSRMAENGSQMPVFAEDDIITYERAEEPQADTPGIQLVVENRDDEPAETSTYNEEVCEDEIEPCAETESPCECAECPCTETESSWECAEYPCSEAESSCECAENPCTETAPPCECAECPCAETAPSCECLYSRLCAESIPCSSGSSCFPCSSCSPASSSPSGSSNPPGVAENRMVIALTFDDGPAYFTSQLLDILDEHGGRVTFCVIGNLVENGAATVVRAFESGHEIVGHSWDHSDLGQLEVEEIIEQILRTSAIIYEITGEQPPPIFRTPFGRYNNRIYDAARETGYSVLNWSIDPRDWRYRDEDHIYEFIMENARHGAIILLHDIWETTVLAMERVIPALLEEGFELVTATEIIYYVYGGLEPGFEFTGVRR